MNTRSGALLAALCLSFAASSVVADSKPGRVPGEKLDSGLGELPHYSQWVDKTGRQPVAYRVPGESLDDGLGELPHYSKWIDKTGRDPMQQATRTVAAKR
ncbi:MAG: hypothetical protein JNJ89_10480 [Rubrivivax sp.]|nr:hypothetical protein [Rubrivivax sp.]